jgi:hypothetical protein
LVFDVYFFGGKGVLDKVFRFMGFGGSKFAKKSIKSIRKDGDRDAPC